MVTCELIPEECFPPVERLGTETLPLFSLSLFWLGTETSLPFCVALFLVGTKLLARAFRAPERLEERWGCEDLPEVFAVNAML